MDLPVRIRNARMAPIPQRPQSPQLLLDIALAARPLALSVVDGVGVCLDQSE